MPLLSPPAPKGCAKLLGEGAWHSFVFVAMLPEPLSHQVKPMSTRPATATQAEIARAIRALVDAGFTHPRVVYSVTAGSLSRGQSRTIVPTEDPEEEEVFTV